MSGKDRFNEGYQPQKVEKGYQPIQQPTEGVAQNGYQPATSQTSTSETSTGESPTNPPPKAP